MHALRFLVALSFLYGSPALAQSEPSAPRESAPLPAPSEGAMPEPDSRESEAAAHFGRGVELYREGAFQPALVEFQHAYETLPDYRLLYNIGQTQRRLQDYLGAMRSYRKYLGEGGDEIAPERREQVEETLASLRQRIGRIELRVSRADAELAVDDARVGTSPLSAPVEVNVGRHRVSARTPDGASDAVTVEVAGGEVAQVTLVLPDPVSRAARSTPVAAAVAPPRARWTSARKAAVMSWSLGAAALVAGAISGGLTKKRNDELDDLLAVNGINPGVLHHKRESVRKLSRTTDVLVGTGIAAAAAGTLLWLLPPRPERALARPAKSARVRLDVGLSSLSLHGRF